MYGIFTYIYHKNHPNKGKLPYMEHLGYQHNIFWQISHGLGVSRSHDEVVFHDEGGLFGMQDEPGGA